MVKDLNSQKKKELKKRNKKNQLIILKQLDLNKDITKNYQKWMNDPEVHKYTEQKYKRHSLMDIRNFVKEKNKSKNNFLYGIFLIQNNLSEHIGNIKLGPINLIHKSAEISYFIGAKELWGNGYTTKAIKEIIKIAKNKGIKKLKAGLIENNIGSKKVLIKNGFKVEGKLKAELIFNRKRVDSFLMGKIL